MILYIIIFFVIIHRRCCTFRFPDLDLSCTFSLSFIVLPKDGNIA